MSPRVLIADDEPLLRQQFENLINRVWPEARIVASASNGAEARLALYEQRPDVAFLDIRMPSPNGLELAEEFTEEPILIVFVTAYDQYAVAAFEKNACDYLLKPISEDRFRETVNRLKNRLETSDTTIAIESIRREIENLKSEPRFDRIPVHHRGETKLISVSDIRYFKADAKYTLAFDASNEYVLSATLRVLEEKLDPDVFWRIHRNCIVNANFIESIHRTNSNTMVVRVTNRKEELRVSRNYRHRFHEL